jgi:hypothetical protein
VSADRPLHIEWGSRIAPNLCLQRLVVGLEDHRRRDHANCESGGRLGRCATARSNYGVDPSRSELGSASSRPRMSRSHYFSLRTRSEWVTNCLVVMEDGLRWPGRFFSPLIFKSLFWPTSVDVGK